MKDCIFCKLKKNSFIYENDEFYSIFDAHPVSPGHALVIPKKHVVSLLDLNDEQWSALKPAIKEVIKIIEITDKKELYEKMIKEKITEKSPWFCRKMLEHKSIDKRPDGYNIGNNEGIAAGRTVHHLHVQIIPRYKGDVENPTGGIRTIFPALGNYKK